MTEPVPPFVLVQLDDFDVEAFDDIRALGGFLEPPDFSAGTFAFFDSVGRRGELRVDGWDVNVEAWELETHEEELKEYLLRFIEASGQVPSSEKTADLVHQAVSLTKASQPRLWPFKSRRKA